MSDIAQPKTCFNCLHWLRHDDNSQSGACMRVEMAGSLAIVATEASEGALVTRPSFSCNQHEDGEI